MSNEKVLAVVPKLTNPADILEATKQTLARQKAAIIAMDTNAAAAIRQEAITTAMTLNADGQISCPNALCLTLNVPRYIYDQAVRYYAKGRPSAHKFPRRLRAGPSPTMRMLQALVICGDVRFASRQMPTALQEES